MDLCESDPWGQRGQVLRVFEALPLLEQLWVRARLSSAPWSEVLHRIPKGSIADIGCGHGLLVGWSAMRAPAHMIIGADIDARKIALARRGPGRLPNVRLVCGSASDLLPEHEGRFDAVTVMDVLYLLPTAHWLDFLRSCRRLLRPGGVLLLKEAQHRGHWKYWKWLAQEHVTVKLLRRTRSSGAVSLPSRDHIERVLAEVGFKLVEIADLSDGYSTPHVLFLAQRPPAQMPPHE